MIPDNFVNRTLAAGEFTFSMPGTAGGVSFLLPAVSLGLPGIL